MYLISDLHLGHKKILTFVNEEGNLMRKFENIDHMNSVIIQNWNDTVKKEDTVIVLGDVVWEKKYIRLLGELNGNKELIVGNHDRSIDRMRPFFTKVSAMTFLPFKGRKAVLTHIPCHPSSVADWGYNIHGHIHEKSLKDPMYFNVSCEQLDYTPIHINTLETYEYL